MNKFKLYDSVTVSVAHLFTIGFNGEEPDAFTVIAIHAHHIDQKIYYSYKVENAEYIFDGVAEHNLSKVKRD